MGYPFDKITYAIEEFVQTNSGEFQKIKLSVTSEVYAPFKEHANRWLSTKESETLISNCKEIAISKIESLVKDYATEMWYVIIRRFPNTAFPNPLWRYYSTLAALKWSKKENIFNLGFQNGETRDTRGVAFAFTEEFLFDTLRLASYCDCLGNLVYTQRWIGKGLKLFVDPAFNLILSIEQDVIDSVHAYEARRPKDILFGETANPYFFPANNKSEIVFLTDVVDSIPIYLSKSNLILFFNRFVSFADIKNILAFLLPYRDPILDLYKIEIEAIIQTYYALSQRIKKSIPFHKINVINGRIEVASDLDDPVDNKQLNFFFSICHTAYLRFHLNTFKSELCEVEKHPLISTEKTKEELVEDFFDTFLLDDLKRERIDFQEVNNPPVIFLNQNEMCYWDLQYFYDFFRGLVENSKNWLSTQHGDRFTLMIKSYLEKEIPGLSTILFKKKMNFEKELFEIDLLVQFKSKYFLIEAKAFAKNRDFWNGYRKAVTYRSARIDKAVKQVLKTHDLLIQYIKAGRFEKISDHRLIEWVVCLPEQEYLHPLNKHGLINDMPKVCTMEELVKIITS